MSYQYFRVTVKHDKGRSSFRVWATAPDHASYKVEQAEQCPRSAIVKIQPINHK
jgi:hypothetical protein